MVRGYGSWRCATRAADSNMECIMALTNGIFHQKMASMDAIIITLDSAGRVVIPKAVRDELRLAPGDALALQSDGEHVTLQPVRSGPGLSKERGIWVFRSGAGLTAEETDRALDGVRQERERRGRGTSA